MLFLPNLVLDRIFCHVVDGCAAATCPPLWLACLNSVHPALVPRFTRALMRQCAPFSLLRGRHRAGLVHIKKWIAVHTQDELAPHLEGLVLAAIEANDLESVDWLFQHRVFITSQMVNAASSSLHNGVTLLDRLWNYYHRSEMPSAWFPHTAAAVDNAVDVATLDWWWHKYTEHDVPFRYRYAAYFAFAGWRRQPLDQHDDGGDSRQVDYPLNWMEICRWWEARATNGDLRELVVLCPDDRGASFPSTTYSPASDDDDSDDDDNNNNRLTEPDFHLFDVRDLIDIAAAGIPLPALEWWSGMLERGFVPPIPDGMEGDEEDDLFSGTWRIGIPLMEWWLDLNRKYPHIPHPRADWVMASASRHGDTALLDWVLDAANNGVMTLELPESVLVDRGSVRPVSEWWRSSAAKGKVEWIPIFAWTSCIEDTVDDLEFFWALQFGPGTAAQPPPIVIYITFPSWLFAFDPQALEWIARTRAVGQEPIPQLHQSWTFQASWNAHRYDTLDALINHFTQRPPSHNQSLGHAIFYRVLDATGRGDLGLLEWWYAHPILRAAQVTATTTGLAQSNLEQALCHGDTDTATWWLNKTVVREGGDLSVSVPTLLDRVCRMKPALGVDYRPRALKWMVDNGLMAAAGSIAVDTLESLIRDRKGEYHQAAFLAWLASDGDPVAQEVLGAPRFGEKAEDAEVRVEWERIRRVARLSGV